MAMWTGAHRVLVLQADGPYNLECPGDCSEQLFGAESIAALPLHPCISLRDCVVQAWVCEPCFQKLKSPVIGYVTCEFCKVRQSVSGQCCPCLRGDTSSMTLVSTAGCWPEMGARGEGCRMGDWTLSYQCLIGSLLDPCRGLAEGWRKATDAWAASSHVQLGSPPEGCLWGILRDALKAEQDAKVNCLPITLQVVLPHELTLVCCCITCCHHPQGSQHLHQYSRLLPLPHPTPTQGQQNPTA